MIAIEIPGFGNLKLQNLVLDFNGTLALDGRLLPGVAEQLAHLAAHLGIQVITADTFGQVGNQIAGLPVTLEVIPLHNQAEAKLAFIERLGASTTVAIGNGRNDYRMLSAAALGIALIQGEGGAASSMAAADLVFTSVNDALGSLQNPQRLVATLRS